MSNVIIKRKVLKGGFTLEEKEQFRNSLLDLASRIRKTAEKI